MKYLGIDYGSKRIGVAVSDEAAMLAFPLGTVEAGRGALEEVQNIARENAVAAIVMGESKNFQGEKNPIMKAIETFAAELEAAGFSVLYEPEFMSSAAAAHQFAPDGSRKQIPPQKMLDASAAAILLQSFLDRRKQRVDVD